MNDFSLATTYPLFASDEGPPFGRELIFVFHVDALERVTELYATLVRWN